MKPTVLPSAVGLVRVMGPLMATAVVVGTVIGSGIFKKPQAVAEQIPFFGLAAMVWILGGLMALLGALALAEVAVLFPRAGGNYVFLREGYGRLAGFLWGWVEFWIIRSASIAALATIFTESFSAVLRELAPATSDLLGYWPQRGLTVAVILGLALINARGVRWGGGLQVVITTIKVASLLGILVLPFAVWALAAPSASPINPDNLQPTWPSWDQLDFGMLGRFITALLGVLWAYHGWMNIGWMAAEVREPQRYIPLALIGGVGIIVGLYLGCNLAYCLVLPQQEMAQMKEPRLAGPQQGSAPEAANVDRTVAIGFTRRLLGPMGVGLAAAAVMCSVFGALNGNLMVGPRLLYAMGEDGLAPRALSAVHPTYHTPVLAILLLAIWSALLVLGAAGLTQIGALSPAKDHFDVLTDFAMFGAVIFETMAVAAIFVFRRTLPHAPRPYRCWGYPVVPAVYILFPLLVLGNMFIHQGTEASIGVGFIALGAAIYALFLRRPSARQAG